jgi:predicted RNA-binding Zn ribbon-like protein
MREQVAVGAAREWMLADEATPIRLMATIWADVSGVHDDLRSAADLTAWLDAAGVDHGDQLATGDELKLARRLRDAVRRLAAQVTGDEREAARSATADVEEAVRDLNEVLAYLPAPRIAFVDGALRQSSSGGASAVTAGLAYVAHESIELLTGPDAGTLRACYAPGCVLYFAKTHPRREWCSVTCGNRVRAARHYDRVRSARGI